MQRAAAGLATAVGDLLGATYGARVLLLVGPGDNGGDALYAGAMLARRGAQVQAVAVGDRVHEAGADRPAAGRRPRLVDLADVRRPDVVVDGIVGIGGHPGLRAPATEALAARRRRARRRGGHPERGRRRHRPARGSPRDGRRHRHLRYPQDLPPGRAGGVGLRGRPARRPRPRPARGRPVTALQADDVARLLPIPPADAQKYTRGVVGVRAGSARYPGAGVLSTAGAACGLAGMVRYAGGAPRRRAGGPPRGRASARVASGLGGRLRRRRRGGGGAERRPCATTYPSSSTPTPWPTSRPGSTGPRLLTPHAGELAAMLGVDRARWRPTSSPPPAARRDRWDATVLLKGHHTLVAEPDGRVRVTTDRHVLAGGRRRPATSSAASAAPCWPPASRRTTRGRSASWLHGAAAT